mgnify:CR=1 FL=1
MLQRAAVHRMLNQLEQVKAISDQAGALQRPAAAEHGAPPLGPVDFANREDLVTLAEHNGQIGFYIERAGEEMGTPSDYYQSATTTVLK